MAKYSVSVGLDVASEDLVVINPQCRSDGVKYLRRMNAASGAVSDQGAYIELEWSILGNAAAYVALLTQFGLDEATTSPVTIFVRDEFWSFNIYNGLAKRPSSSQDRNWAIFPRDIVILITNLEQLVEV